MNGYIKRRHGLVGDYQLRLRHQGSRNADSLSLSPTELMGVSFGVITAQSDNFKQLMYFFLSFLGRTDTMDNQGFFQYFFDCMPRVQRGIWILENHLNIPADLSHFCL
ncbi:hypothetical protein BSG1_05689 [Bacillus sp. SG-1]|nr:hypothetical protein BSG1_05689 [Bacillus sp. SG-1]